MIHLIIIIWILEIIKVFNKFLLLNSNLKINIIKDVRNSVDDEGVHSKTNQAEVISSGNNNLGVKFVGVGTE